MSNIFTVFNGNYGAGSSLVASATGLDGNARALISGGTVTADSIEAIATSAAQLAVITLDDVVNGGSIVADGGAGAIAEVAFGSGASLSAVGLQTIGTGEIGVFNPGSATSETVVSGTVSKGSFIFDNGDLTFSGGSALTSVTFDSDAGSLTLSGMTFAAGEHFLAQAGGELSISAASGGAATFSAGDIVRATDGGSVYVSGSAVNFGTMHALAAGGLATWASIYIYGGTAGTFTNQKGGVMEADSLLGYTNDSEIYLSAGGAVANSGTIEGVASGFDFSNYVELYGGSFTNAKGASITQSVTGASRSDELYVYGSAGLTNAGSITGSASNDANHDEYYNYIETYTAGGTISNTGTMAAIATTSSQESLYATDDATGSGSLTNRGLIAATASQDSFTYLSVRVGSSITNDGNIDLSVTSGSTATADEGFYTKDYLEAYGSAGSIINAGTIDASASGDSKIPDLYLLAGSGGLTNSGTKATIEAVAASDSYTNVFGVIGGSGNLTNTNVMDAVATAKSTAYQGFYLNGESNGPIVGNVSNSKTMGAQATTGSFAEFYVDEFNSATNTGTFTATATSGSSALGYLGYYYDEYGDSSVTNNKLIAATESGDSYAYMNVAALGTNQSYYGQGGSNALINNTSAIEATATAGGTAQMDLDAGSYYYPGDNYGAVISNTGTIESLATAGATAWTNVDVYSSKGSIVNNKLEEAVTNGGKQASLTDYVEGALASITNTNTIAALATGGSAMVYLGGYGGAIVNNTGGTLLASESGGSAWVDLGDYEATVSGGTLKSIGAHAEIGVTGLTDSGTYYDYETASATDVNIANGTHIVAFGADGEYNELYLTDVGTISAAVTVEAAKYGYVYVEGPVTNSGTVEAVGSDDNYAFLYLDGGSGTITNDKTVEIAAISNGDYYYVEATISAGTVINAKGAIIEQVSTAESESDDDYSEIYGSSIFNSGTLLASASGSSEAGLYVSAATLTTNTGNIVANATGESDAYVELEGPVTNFGSIAANGDSDSFAYIELDGSTINNTGGNISATGNGWIYLDASTISGGTLKTSGAAAQIVAYDNEEGTIEAATIVAGSFVGAYYGGELTLGNGTIVGSNHGKNGAIVEAYSYQNSDAGTVNISGTVSNSGTIEAGGENGSGYVNITSGAMVTGNAVTVGTGGTVTVASGGAANIDFSGNGAGYLHLADSAGNPTAFGGTVGGFGGVGGVDTAQLIVLDRVTWSAGITATYSATSSASNPALDLGTLTVSSGGSAVASITLEGNYLGATFNVVDEGGKAAISDPMGPTSIAAAATPTLASTASAPPSLVNVTGASNAALFGSYMASLFASAEGSVTALGTEAAQSQAMLVHPHSG